MQIIELIIDETEEVSGIEAISIVSAPAIEEGFIALKNETQVRLAEVDKEKRLLIGAALIPDKTIYRKTGDEEFYIYFSKATVAKASQMYLQAGNQGQATLEHASEKLEGMNIVESWLIEDEVHDKSKKYGLNLPLGTWMITMKVDNDEMWNNYVKKNLVSGFSIEGYFIDRLKKNETDKYSEDDKLLKEIIDVLEQENHTNTK
jgi:hypothetical protein|tara:strand:- start:789 stop:1400 length:612 start_codon:yes stop_codon:yes gene_type:complete